jgi:hypothetical protein
MASIFGQCDNILAQIVNREMSLFSKRPQDYIVALLSASAFRVATSGFYLASAGYPDVVPILGRTIWEISIRLFDFQQNPVELSLAYILNSKWMEIKTITAEIEYRRSNNIQLEALERNLESIKKKYNEISAHAENLGFEPDKIRKDYKKTSLKEICRKLGPAFEKSYDVDYSDACGHSHGAGNSFSSFLNLSSINMEFNMGPIVSSECLASASDIISYLSRVLSISAEITEDSSIVVQSRELTLNVRRAIDEMQKEYISKREQPAN